MKKYVVVKPWGERTRPCTFDEAEEVREQWASYGIDTALELAEGSL